MSGVDDRLEALEKRVEELERSSLEARVDGIRGRIDDLKVQSALAKLDARDEVKAAFDSLESAWREARSTLENLAAEGRSAGASVADRTRDALGDLRSGFERVADALRRND